MKRSIAVLWPVFVLAIAGCQRGETRQQVIDRYRPRMDALRERLKAIHARLPAVAVSAEARLDPPPLYTKARQTGNTEFLAAEQLLDADARPPFDLILSHDLKTCLLWTGPHSPMSAKSLRERANKEVEESFQRALAVRYLVVLRSWGAKISVEGDTFSGGSGSVEAFVVDLKTDAIVGATSANASPGGRVSFQTRAGENREERGAAAVHSDTWVNLRAELGRKLVSATGGQFQLE